MPCSKDINETLGHHLGDELLRQIPERFAGELGDDDALGRLGGDEYLAVVRRPDRDRVTRLADRVLRALEQPFLIGEHQLFITASIGLAFLDSASASPAELIQNVDDFGIGYSSLAYLKNFPISTIKIDQGFIRGLDNDTDDQAITRTICDLSREMRLTTVAEGIEQPGQFDLLRQYGCNLGQGFLFMHPVPAEEIAGLLAGPLPWAGLAAEPRALAGRGQGS